jgi:hypothetical protein
VRYALILLLLAPFAAHADCTHNWMQCPIDSSLQINSFTIQAAETIEAITAARIKATKGLQTHAITVTQAKAVLVKTDRGRALWQQARAVCHADEHGNCDTATDSSKAFALLDWARRKVK